VLSRWSERLRNHRAGAAGFLTLAVLTTYAGTLRNTFVYDDIPQIIANPFIQNPRLWTHIFTGSVWSFKGVPRVGNFYRPLQFLYYWLVYRAAGPNAAAFHLLQMFLYAATAWLVYRVGRELIGSESAAFLGATLWILHPLHVEAVAWISAMPEMGFAFFYLLSFLLFIRAEKASVAGPELAPASSIVEAGASRGRGKPRPYRFERVPPHLLAALVYLPALFFKEMAASLPLLLLAYWWFLGSQLPQPGFGTRGSGFAGKNASAGSLCEPRTPNPESQSVLLKMFSRRGSGLWGRRFLRLSPYVSAVAVYVVIRVTVFGTVSQHPLWRQSAVEIEAVPALLGQHARLFLLPLSLDPYRSFHLHSALLSPWPWLALAALGCTLWLRQREPRLGFLVAWWGITLLPCLAIKQLSVPYVADRFSYLPSVGLCLALAGAAVRLIHSATGDSSMNWIKRGTGSGIPGSGFAEADFEAGRSANPKTQNPNPAVLPGGAYRWTWRGRAARMAVVPGLVLLAGFWAVRTVLEIPNWRDNDSLIQHSLDQSPDAPTPHLVRGDDLRFRHGDLDGAAREYRLALVLNQNTTAPLDGIPYECFVDLGQVAQQKGQIDEALGYFRKAAAILPGASEAYQALGAFYFPRGNYAEAERYYARAVRADPQDTTAHFALGTCRMKLGDYRRAADEFRAARTVDPSSRIAYQSEARALEALGDSQEASRVRNLAGKVGGGE